MEIKKKQVFNLKLSEFKTNLLSPQLIFLYFGIVFFLFHFPGEWTWKSWVHYHSGFLFLLFVLYLSFEIWNLKNENRSSFIVSSLRTIVFFLLVLALNYQWVFQTEVRFSLVSYAFLHAKDLIYEFDSFFGLWTAIHYFPLVVFLIFHKTKFLQNKLRLGLVIFVYFVIVFASKLDFDQKDVGSQLQNRNQKVNRYLDQIPENTNIVMVVLEGVSRNHILEQKSNYIDYSKLSGSHFFIPMPHTSKSLYTWMTGDSQLNSTRIEVPTKDFDINLPNSLTKEHQYDTQMLYTQSIYFEGMNLYFPNIFSTLWDKTKLESEYKDQFVTFSWGMDDRVILTHLKQSPMRKSPYFILIGLSQTHSPYFSVSDQVQTSSKLIRHKQALSENIKLIDDLIVYFQSKSKTETLLIITADHGESFGEEGAQIHNYSLYNQELDVPFLFYFIQSKELYVPHLGSSIHFKDTILDLLSKGKTKSSKNQNTNQFFSKEYKLDLICKTWNSDIQRGLITEGKKYIFHSDTGILYEMDLDDSHRIPISNGNKKESIIRKMYESIFSK